jgi:hypothetical protein
MLIAWGISQYLGPGLTDISGTIIGADFLCFFTGGNFFLNGRMDQLYDFRAHLDFQKSVVAPAQLRSLHYYSYPPFTAVFYSLFSMTNYLTDLIIWWTFGLLLLFLSVIILRLELKRLASLSVPRLFLTCFLFFPTIYWFISGHNSALSLFLFTVFYVMLRRRYDTVAGISLGLLLYKPQLAIALGFMLLLKRRWRALIGSVCTALIWIFIGFFTSPLAMKRYVEVMPTLLDTFRLNPNFNIGITYPTWGIYSFFGFSSLLLDNIWRTGANLLFIFLSVFGLVSIAKIWKFTDWEPGTRKWDMTMSGTFALGLLIGPQLFIYDLMILLLPLAIVWSYYVGASNERALDGGTLLFWSALLYIACFVGNYVALAQLKFCTLVGLPPFALQFSTLVIFTWACLVIHDGRKSTIQE